MVRVVFLFAFSLVLLVIAAGVEPVRAQNDQHIDGAAFAARPGRVPLAEEDSLIIELVVGQFTLHDSMFVYHNSQYTLLPLQELLSALEFPIEVDPERGLASGWFIAEDRTFNLNIPARSLYIAGQRVPFPDDFYYSSDDFDLYVDLNSLRRWLGIDLILYTSRLQIEVKSQTPLPIEQRMAREKRRTRTRQYTAKTYPVLADEYAWLGLPVFDVTLEGRTGTEGERYAYAIQGGGDFLQHATQLSVVRSDDRSASTTRFSMSRKSIHHEKDLFFGVTEYEMGDVIADGNNLTNQSHSGVGIRIRRYSPGQNDATFSRKTIDGNARPGWEAELYRNGLLIDFQTVSSDGRYVFEDVVTQYGENLFEVKLYGPQGQVKIEQQRVQIGSQMVEPGQWRMKLDVTEENEVLIGDRTDQADPLAAARPVSQSIDFAYEYGVTETQSLGVGASQSAPAPGLAERDYASVIWQSSLANFATRLMASQDLEEEGGEAYSFDLTGRMLNQDWNLSHRQYQDFTSQRSLNGALESDSQIDVFGQFSPWLMNSIPYSLRYQRLATVNGTRTDSFDGRLTYYRGNHRIVSEHDVIRSSELDDYFAGGTFSYYYSASVVRFRSAFNYRLEPESEADSLVFTLDFRRPFWNLQLRANAALSDIGRDAGGFSVTRDFDWLRLSLNGDAESGGEKVLSLTLEFALDARRKYPGVGVVRENSAGQGRLHLRAFLDENANGRREPYELPLSGLKFDGRSRWRSLQTDAVGEVVLSGLDADDPTLVRVNELSLQDPYLKASRPAFRVVSHEGAYQYMDVPIVPTTELEGTVYFQKGTKTVGASAVQLELLDQQGRVVDRVASEYDGYYLFSFVPPGQYRVRVDANSVRLSKAKMPASRAVTTDREAGVTYVDDLVIVIGTGRAAPDVSALSESAE